MTPKKYRRSKRSSSSPSLLVVGGLILIVIAILAFKPRADSPAGSLPEQQLASALAAHQPAFVFLHSLDCIPCKDLMGIVDEVYPEFAGEVVLVDVNVYDKRNANLLRREGLQVIPTLVFYDQTGKRQVHVGVLEALQLRQTLAALAGGH